jgi:hypothetical protein
MNFEKIDIIAQNFEKYMTIRFANFVILDSYAFLSSSLDELSKILLNDSIDNFKYSIQPNYTKEQKLLLLKKGVYPYEYIDSYNRFNETELPSKDKFYSKLADSHITDDEYEHAQKLWNTFQIKNLGEYHDLYLKTDVLLLSDILINFQKKSLLNYNLDPLNGFLTLPHYAWNVMLYKTNIQLEQLTDPDMYLFCEQAKRGGISMISHRYAEANNKYMKHYNPNVESSYISYYDANNLYGGAMCEKLPYKDFRWSKLTKDEISNYNADGDEGCFIECDLEYPEELFNLHNDYPLAPEKCVLQMICCRHINYINYHHIKRSS